MMSLEFVTSGAAWKSVTAKNKKCHHLPFSYAQKCYENSMLKSALYEKILNQNFQQCWQECFIKYEKRCSLTVEPPKTVSPGVIPLK